MSRMEDQIYAARALSEMYTEYMINPDYPQDVEQEFANVMSFISVFVKD